MTRTITVTYADGSQKVYQGAPDDTTPAKALARAERDGGDIISIDGGAANNAEHRQITVPVNRSEGTLPSWLSDNVIGAIGLALLLTVALSVRAISRSGLGPRLRSAWTSSKVYRGLRPHLANLRFICLLGAGAFMVAGSSTWPKGAHIDMGSRRDSSGALYYLTLDTFPRAPFAIAIGAMLLATAWLYRPRRKMTDDQR